MAQVEKQSAPMRPRIVESEIQPLMLNGRHIIKKMTMAAMMSGQRSAPIIADTKAGFSGDCPRSQERWRQPSMMPMGMEMRIKIGVAIATMGPMNCQKDFFGGSGFAREESSS